MSLPEALLGLIAALFGGAEPDPWNGYAEADRVLVAPVSAGRLATVVVDQGDRVAAGQLLATLDAEAETAALAAAEAAVAGAEATLADLRTGRRPEEIAVTRATLHKAEADLGLARVTLDRSAQLLAQGRVPQATVDQDQATLRAAEAQVEQLRAELAVAGLPAREGQRLAAEATLRQARAQATSARVALENRRLAAPLAGLVETRVHEPGDVVTAGAPVLALYDPDRLHAVFFLPEADRLAIHPGDRLAVACSGCAEGLRARVTRLASDAQYTPPMIYSRDERARLVFRAEATLDPGSGLLPGQPLTLVRAP